MGGGVQNQQENKDWEEQEYDYCREKWDDH